MSGKGKVPDAWDDDDWINKADTNTPRKPSPPPKKLTKAERRAQQAEFNRQLWAEAESPAAPYYVETKNEAPLQSSFKPNVTLLARKPAQTLVARRDPVTGLEKLTLEDDDGDDDDEERPKQMTAEERMLKAQQEREEKQRRYEEARERLFGPSTSGSTSPRSSTPIRSSEKNRGRGRGAIARESRDSRPVSRTKQLFDPNSSGKSEVANPGIETDSPIIRNPRGPDGSGRGGIGFAPRGNKSQEAA